MATSWGYHPEEDEPPARRRVGYRASTFAASVTGLVGETAIHLTQPGGRVGHVWRGARVPFLAAMVLAVAQVPLSRRTASRTLRPERSELARHLSRRTRKED